MTRTKWMMVARIMLSCVTTLTLWLPNISYAQSQQSISTAPQRTTVDTNNVDLATGSVQFILAGASIGSGSDQLSFTRTLRNTGWYNSINAKVTNLNNGSVDLTFGDSSKRYVLSSTAGLFLPVNGDGSSLKQSGGVYTLTSADGSVAIFDTSQGNRKRTGSSGSGVPYGSDAPITSYTTSTGEQQIYTYVGSGYQVMPGSSGPQYVEYTRVQSITNNSGYHLKISYKYDTINTIDMLSAFQNLIIKVILLNSRLDTCSTTAFSCTPSGPRPSIDMSVSGQYTDSLGRQTILSNTTNSISLKTPGRSSPNLMYDLDANQQVTQANIDGILTTYNYLDSGGIRLRFDQVCTYPECLR